MPTSTVFSAKHHKCLSTLPFGVFSPSYAMNSGARGLHSLGFPWAYAEVTKLVLKMSSSILFFAQFERSYYLRSFRSLFSIAATIYCCVRTAAIASYDDVGRSPAPQPIEMSLSEKISLCRSTMLRCPRRYLCHMHPQKNSLRFLFSGESARAETPAEQE